MRFWENQAGKGPLDLLGIGAPTETQPTKPFIDVAAIRKWG